jgi:DNA invertase Pin-like site-specific DNA recombinase
MSKCPTLLARSPLGSMARVGYCRTSTDRQELGRQQRTLKASGCDRIHEETASGKTLDRPVLNEVLASLVEGDVLVVHELDRLGRSMVQMLQVAENLMDRGIGLVTLDGKLSTESMDSSIVKLVVGILGYAAEMERKAIIKRTEEGRVIAMEAGVKFGRKRSYSKGEENHVRELRATGLGYGAIATKTGLSISTVRRILA